MLSKDPFYAVRFGRAENLFSQIDKDDLMLSINENEKNLLHPTIVTFPSAENKFKMDLGTEDKTIPSHEIARCFGCGAQLQCSDRTKAYEVDEQVYTDIQAEIKRECVLIILVVDLLGTPNSISRSWAHCVDQTSQLTKSSLNIVTVLGNKVDLLPNGGVYLPGATNTGKSSLFNSLIDSDLCHIHALDCIQRVTISNLLLFTQERQ
ncbi:unnamed protein product [Adineta ricciae]|uniref:Uncharacterized protein n=1 Tax=Adineta ricciae TaxID=249248 RepID=A0A815KMX4_ADIRI|nr:unnamed protein product [Adineta ricciae]CAF1524727.1 unnamed protein product [Adineta ricciae]